MTTSDDLPVTFDAGDLSAFQVNAGEGDPKRGFGSYTDWVALIREVLTPRITTLEDFLPDAVVTDRDEHAYLEECVLLAKFQMHAPVNNRRATLHRLATESVLLDEALDGGKLPDYKTLEKDVSVEFAEMCYFLRTRNRNKDVLTSEVRAEIEQLRRDVDKSIRDLYESMVEDRRNDEYIDHGRLQAELNKKQPNISVIADLLPEFAGEAFTHTRSTESNTRRRQIQAVVARQLDYVDSPAAAAAAAQNKLLERRAGPRTGNKFNDDISQQVEVQ